jgi:hypothetical protein
MIKNIDALVDEIIDATEDSVQNKNLLLSVMKEHFSFGNVIVLSKKMLKEKDVSKIHPMVLYRIVKTLKLDTQKYFGDETASYGELLNSIISLENRVDVLEKEKRKEGK